MASDVFTHEEFRAHIKRMVTWMQITQGSDKCCPCCGKPMNDEKTRGFIAWEDERQDETD